MKNKYSHTLIIKTITLFLFLASFCTVNSQTTYFLRNEGGNWNANTTWSTVSSSSSINAGTFPTTGDDVYFNGTGTVNLNITANAACANFYNESTTSVSLNLNFSNNATLAVSGLFQITTTPGISRTTNVNFASGATVAYLTVGTHIYSGTLDTASYTACANVLNLAGPDVTVSGNVNIFNNTNGTIHMRSMISHTAGKLKLIGTGTGSGTPPDPETGFGYLRTYQNNGNLDTNNRYQMSGTASLEFYHVGDTPVYVNSTHAAITSPIFNGSENNKVTYFKNSSVANSPSVIYANNYSKLAIDNSNVNTISATGTTVNKELNIISGSLSLQSTTFNYRTLVIGNLCKINISSSGRTEDNFCITSFNGTAPTPARLSYSGLVEINYSGNAKRSGIELRTFDGDKGVSSLSISGTSNFNLATTFSNYDASINNLTTLNVRDSITISDNNFTCNPTEIVCPSITIIGGVTNPLTINSNLTSTNSNSGITLSGSTINLNGTLSAGGSSNLITITGTTVVPTKSISTGGTLTIDGGITASQTGTISASSINLIGAGNKSLSNLTASNTNGIYVTGTTINLNGPVDSSNGTVTINGATTASANASITAPTVILDGDNSSYSGLITTSNSSTGLSILGSSIFNANINSKKVTVGIDSPCTFKETLLNIEYLTINSPTIIKKDQSISNTLTLADNLTNYGKITTNNLTILETCSLDANGTGVLRVKNLLSVAQAKTLTTGDELVLVSDSQNTARVAAIHNTALSGKVTVERYLPNQGRKWRLLTSPLKGASNNTLYANWMNNGVDMGGLPFGTDIWGPVSTYDFEEEGLFYIPTSTHNFRKYINGTWYPITNSKTEELFNSNRNNAFLTFITYPAFLGITLDNYPECGPVANSGSTTLVAKGELITGDQSYDVTGSTYHLIGNPYASPIDFSEIIAENTNAIDAKIWILDPKIGTFGSYITWDPINEYNDVESQNKLNGTTIIQSGQGFFVKRKTGNTSIPLVIKENNKTSGNFNNVFGRSSNTIERIRVSVEKFEENSYEHKDACVVGFYEGASNAVTGSDVQKFTNAAETLAFVNGNTSLSSEHRLPVVNDDALFIRLTNGTVSNYKLKINTENFTFSGEAIFYDLKLGTSTIMPLDGSIFEYNFDVTSDPTTQGTRFKIVFNTTLSIDDNNIFTLKVYPNPSTVSQGITLNTGNLELGNYVYKIINVLGQEIQKGTIENTQKNQDIKIDFANNISSGWYTIQILNINKSIINSLPIILK